MILTIAFVCLCFALPIMLMTPTYGPYNKKLRRVNKFREPKNN